MAEFRLVVTMGLAGCKREHTFEIPDGDLEGLTELERLNLLFEYGQDELPNVIDWGVEEA